jgi:hypothetical protein
MALKTYGNQKKKKECSFKASQQLVNSLFILFPVFTAYLDRHSGDAD